MWNSHTPPLHSATMAWRIWEAQEQQNQTILKHPSNRPLYTRMTRRHEVHINFYSPICVTYETNPRLKKFRSYLEQHNTDIPLRQQILLLFSWKDGYHANAIKEYITFQNMQTKSNFKSFRKRTYQTLELWATNAFTYMLEAKCVDQIKLSKM